MTKGPCPPRTGDAVQLMLILDEYTNDPATAFELGWRWGIER